MSSGGMDDVYRVGLHLDTSSVAAEGQAAGRQAAAGFQQGFGNVDLDKTTGGLAAVQEGAARASGSVQRLSREFLVLGSGVATGTLGIRELSLIAIGLGHHLGEEGLAGGITRLGGVMREVFTNPVTIAIAGIGALGFALSALRTESSQTEVALARQKKVVDDLKEGYGAAATKALELSKVPGEARSVDVAAAETNIAQLQENLKTRMERFRGLVQAALPEGAEGSPIARIYNQITEAIDKFNKVPRAGLQDVIRFRETLGRLEQSIPVGDPMRREVEMFLDANDASKKLAQSLAEQETAQAKLAEGIDPVVQAYKELRDAAADAAEGVGESYRKIDEAIRAQADAAEKQREADARAAVTARFAGPEQALQARQLEVLAPRRAALGLESAQMSLRRAQFEAQFAPQTAEDAKESADIDLQEFQLTYGRQQREIMRGPRATRGLELQRLELRRRALERADQEATFGRDVQGEETEVRLRQGTLSVEEARQRREQAGVEAGKARMFERAGLSPTGGPGPAEAAAKAARDAAAASDGIAKAGDEVAKAIRGVGQAIDKEREASFGLRNFERFHPDAMERTAIGAPGPGAGLSGAAVRGEEGIQTLDVKARELGAAFDELKDKFLDVGFGKFQGLGSSPGDSGNGQAGGGLVRGPGTGTSDSVPARLSSGEYVIRAAAVERFGLPFLDEINSGGVGYARGGRVTLSGVPSRGNVPAPDGSSPGLWRATMALRAAAASGGNVLSALGAVGQAAVDPFEAPMGIIPAIGGDRAAARAAEWSRIGPSLLSGVDRLSGTQSELGGAGTHTLDLRTNAGSFSVYADGPTLEAIRASALGEQLYSTGTKPSWYS